MSNVSSTAFPPGTTVELFAFGATRPGEGTNGDEHKKVGKDGMVAFDVKHRLGQMVWLAGEVGDEWQTVQAPVKDGKASDVVNPGEALSKVATPSTHPSNEPIHGARSTVNTRSGGTGSGTRKAEDAKQPVSLSGAEALHASASGSGVTIPDGSHADPSAWESAPPAPKAKRTRKKKTGGTKAKAKKPAKKPAKKAPEKADSGQPTKAEPTHDKPTPV